MDTSKQLFDKMVKLSGDFLNGDYLIDVDKKKINDEFLDGFYKVMRVALDVSVNDEKFNQFVQGGQKDDPVETVRFLIQTLDNDKTYKLMNYYLMNFLLVFSKGAKQDKIPEINEILNKEGLVPQAFATIVSDYRNLTAKTV